MKTQTRAYAKLNISLDVLKKRPDGFHDMRMIMATAGLWDDISIETGLGKSSIQCNLKYLPRDSRNIALKAAELFYTKTGIENPGVSITIEKRIPVCAGLGGGSADAAAVLAAMNGLYKEPLETPALMELAGELGSDVPYCLLGGVALAEGRGERLTPLPPLPDCAIVICKPHSSNSTGAFFSRLDGCRITCHPDTAGLIAAIEAGELLSIARRMYNVFEDVLEKSSPCLEIKNILIDKGAAGAVMSGTGTAVFGIFTDPDMAKSAFRHLKDTYEETFLCRPV